MEFKNKGDYIKVVKGATFLASGGGGPYQLGKSIVDFYCDKLKDITLKLLDTQNVKDTDWACVAAAMGEPSRALQLTPENLIDSVANAVNNMDTLITKTQMDKENFKDFTKLNVLIPVELGAVNTPIPLMMALINRDLSVINGDPSGRAVPTIDLTTYATSTDVMPNMATSDSGNEYLVMNLDNYKVLGLAYSKLIDADLVGGIALGLSLAPMDGEKLKDNMLVKGTVEDAYNIGTLLEKDISSKQRFIEIKEYLETKSKTPRKVKHICTGKVIGYSMESVNDNDLGHIQIQTSENRIFTILVQNENIIGQFDDETQVYVTGPDSIAYLSNKDGILGDQYMFENSLIAKNFEEGIETQMQIIAIEAPEVILDNKELMDNWRSSYEISNYFGKYNSQLWKN